jgi:CRP-like cAMP-binding protein
MHYPYSNVQYFGDVSVLLGVRRTASAKTTTQCTLYRLRKDALLSLLRDYPAIEKKMTNVAQSRRRRLAHHLKPDGVALAPGDEIDAEDSKTELFGRDAGQILQDKEKATELDRIHSGIKIKRRSAIGR